MRFFRVLNRGPQIIQKFGRHFEISKFQKDDMKKVPYQILTSIGHQYRNLIPSNLASRIFCTLGLEQMSSPCKIFLSHIS
jgi:hypothetical protein